MTFSYKHMHSTVKIVCLKKMPAVYNERVKRNGHNFLRSAPTLGLLYQKLSEILLSLIIVSTSIRGLLGKRENSSKLTKEMIIFLNFPRKKWTEKSTNYFS